MADKTLKSPGNVPGPFYVDSSCIDCDMCRGIAPATFRRDDELGQTIAYAQPQTTEEFDMANDAMQSCPTESIGNDG